MSPDSKHTPSVVSVVGVVAMLITGMFVLFNGAQRFNMPVVETDLKQFTAYIADEARKHGREAKFTYGDITVEGWGYDKRAIIHDVSLEILHSEPLFTKRWLFSTASITMRPDRLSAGRLLVDFSEPVNIIKNSHHLYTLYFSDPLNYSHFDGLFKGEHVIEDSLVLPQSLMLKSTVEPGEEASRQQKIEVTYHSPPEIRLRNWPGDGKTEMAVVLENLKIISDGKPEFTIGTFTSYYNGLPDAQHNLKGQFTATAIDFTVNNAGKESRPYSYNLDIDYLAEQGVNHYTLNKCVVTGDNFKVKATGSIATAMDDPLPFGKIELEFSNPRAFINSELLPDHSRVALEETLQKVAGEPVEEKNLTIPLNREKNQLFYIGRATFEEVAATLLAGLFQARPVNNIPSNEEQSHEQ